MMILQPYSERSSIFCPLEKKEPKIEKIEMTNVALGIIHQCNRWRQTTQSDETFWVKIRLKLLLRILKNSFSKAKAKILLILVILELLMSGVPIEALQEIINEVLEEFKKDQKFLTLMQALIPFVLGNSKQNGCLETLIKSAEQLE